MAELDTQVLPPAGLRGGSRKPSGLDGDRPPPHRSPALQENLVWPTFWPHTQRFSAAQRKEQTDSTPTHSRPPARRPLKAPRWPLTRLPSGWARQARFLLQLCQTPEGAQATLLLGCRGWRAWPVLAMSCSPPESGPLPCQAF